MGLVEPTTNQPIEFVGARSPGRIGRHTDSPAVVGLPCHPSGELLGAVAGEDEMRVRVDEAGEHAGPLGVETPIGRRSRGPHVLDDVVDDDDARVLDDPERPASEGGVVGDERPDVVDHQ